MLPLLFVCVSQHRPLRVRNPIRCNRRILSQPCFHRSYSPRYPFGAPLRSHLLYLSVPFLSACRNVLCKTSMINTLFLIAFAYSYSSTGNPDCQCSFCCHAIVKSQALNAKNITGFCVLSFSQFPFCFFVHIQQPSNFAISSLKRSSAVP